MDRHLSEDTFQNYVRKSSGNFREVLYALIVGLLVGLVGAFFRIVLKYIESFRNLLYIDANSEWGESWNWILPILFAVVSIWLALFLVRKFAPETSGSGVHEIEGALDGTRPMRWKRVLPVKFIASLFSLGSGLLLGREGPTIQIGANIGKMIRDLFKQDDLENNSLVSAGSAAGLACAFNAPFAGIIFVMEEMHGHFKFNFFSLSAIMIGASSADLMVRLLTNSNPVINMAIYSSPKMNLMVFFTLLGLLFGFVGLIYNKLLISTLDSFELLKKKPIVVTALLAGLVVSLAGIFNPDLVGGGYSTIFDVLGHHLSLSFLLFLLIIRFGLSLFSYGTGVPGGIFAPMLTLGVLIGMLFGIFMQYVFPEYIHDVGIFAVAGMAAIFASIVRAPLTGLVLAVEMTANYELILPLIVTTLVASLTTSFLSNEPIYSTLLIRTLKKAASKNVKEENSRSHNFREKQYKRRYSEKRK